MSKKSKPRSKPIDASTDLSSIAGVYGGKNNVPANRELAVHAGDLEDGLDPTPRLNIVGVGASAGGLEAIGDMLDGVPKNSGLSFVVVQHMDPKHIGLLPELLQRRTWMRVAEVTDQTRVQANCVYVIPPNKDMSILNGVLQLIDPIVVNGLRHPIDFFLESLADDLQERSVAVLLSGMGTDGTKGGRAIKERGGLVVVQDPVSASFDGMPKSAINAGLAEITAPANEIAVRIISYLNKAAEPTLDFEIRESETRTQVESVIQLLRSHTGHDFSQYKPSTILRRIERRMGAHKISRMPSYVRFMRENPQEVDFLFKELLIGVTSFFRDTLVWDQMRSDVLPALIANHPPGKAIRAWIPGCSTGEEAYSYAMILRELLELFGTKQRSAVQIFATDLDTDAVAHARKGLFRVDRVSQISEERLSRFFIRDPQGFRVSQEIREMVVFAPQNLIMDPPFTKLDLVSCRNLLIYLGQSLQKKLIPLFHYSLNPGGILVLGNAESIGEFTDLFSPVGGKTRIFRRQDSVHRKKHLDFSTAFVLTPLNQAHQPDISIMPVENLQKLADEWLLKHHVPAAALVNDQGDIVYISGRTGSYLEPAAGKANWNIFVMAREGLRFELTDALKKAKLQSDPVKVRCRRSTEKNAASTVELTVQTMQDAGALQGMTMIVFAEVPNQPSTRTRAMKATVIDEKLAEMETQLQQARDEIQRTREDRQTSQEELHSANEELQSTNEELQSTNEELTTSKEEMQSLNEELQTVNAELQSKLDELTATSNDMKNLLNSTEIATIFLDNSLNVRRFTEHVTQVIKVIPTDIGRPVTDLAISVLYPNLVADAREVLRTLISLDKSLLAQDGRWFATRIMPYRTFDNRIDGVVITFTDMTVIKQLEAELDVRKGQSS